MKGDYCIVSKLLAAGRHPSMIVRHAYAVITCAEGEDLDRALGNLAVWLDRVEPGWRTKRRLAWWAKVK